MRSRLAAALTFVIVVTAPAYAQSGKVTEEDVAQAAEARKAASLQAADAARAYDEANDEVAELVVIFPTNVWEYDVLDYFPFDDLEGGAGEHAGSAAGG